MTQKHLRQTNSYLLIRRVFRLAHFKLQHAVTTLSLIHFHLRSTLPRTYVQRVTRSNYSRDDVQNALNKIA